MNRQAVIRRAVPADAGAILELEQHFPTDRMSARSVREFLRSPRARVWVAETATAQIVGNLVLLTRARSQVARIYSLVVDPATRGQGLAQKLLQAAELAAQTSGIIAITLEVRADNVAARALYRKLGYVEAQLLSGFYEDGADALKLRKILQTAG